MAGDFAARRIGADFFGVFDSGIVFHPDGRRRSGKLRLREWRAQVRIARPPEDGEAAAQRVARALLRAYPHLESGELLAVVFYRAADIGLWARAAQTARFERRPEEW